jgi:hypothetical protein
VLLTYENEVFLTNEIYGDKALPCIVPKHNIRIECPLSPVDKVLEPRGPAVKKAADDFCRCEGWQADVQMRTEARQWHSTLRCMSALLRHIALAGWECEWIKDSISACLQLAAGAPYSCS